MLVTHDLEVDTAESAEDALEYLTDHRPDVVFMDHLMPGMDGFEAVTAIKNNPDTATIPIMMYTSQQGEVYVGQARALGAVGVLPKQVEPVEVSKVLASLRLIGGEAEPEPDKEEVGISEDTGDFRHLEDLDHNLRDLISDLFDQQRAVLRRDLLNSYETIASRVADEIRAAEEKADGEEEANKAPFSLLPLLAVVLVVIVVVLGALYVQRDQSWQQLQQQNADLLRAISEQRAAQPAIAEEAQRRLEDVEQAVGISLRAALDAIEWGFNQNSSFAFDDFPLGDDRIRKFEYLTARLISLGFTGTVRVETHVGNFCMAAATVSSWALAPENLPADQCDRIGFEPDEAIEFGSRQSVAFADYVSSSEQRTAGSIRFEFVSLGNAEPAVGYPESGSGITAGIWNEIASLNNRVVVSLFPDSL